jgi:outer membrane cobalamin receptor
MRKHTLLKSGAATAVLALTITAPAYAQDAEAPEETEEVAQAIVVTGSRIENPNLKLSSPVAVVTDVELKLRQTNNAEQFLRELPAAVPSIGSAVNNGNGCLRQPARHWLAA